jgi:hypothetical protein
LFVSINGGSGGLFFFRPAGYLNSFIGVTPKLSVENGWLHQLVFILLDFCWSYSLASALYVLSGFYNLSLRIAPLFILAVLLFSEFIQLAFPFILRLIWTILFPRFLRLF